LRFDLFQHHREIHPSTASKATAARAATAPQGAGAWSQPS